MTVRRSAHGPVVVDRDGMTVALRVSGLDRPRLFEQFWKMGLAHNLDQFQDAMRETGADLRSVAQSTLPTYRWRAEHDYETGTTRNETSDQGAYRGFNPVLTADQRQAKIVFLGSMEPRHQMRVLEQLEAPWLVAGDTMKLYIREQIQSLGKSNPATVAQLIQTWMDEDRRN